MKSQASPRPPEKIVLFVCVGNSGRSQMAQAFFESLPTGWRAASAGVRPDTVLHPLTVEVMAEIGIDVSRKHPKPLTMDLLEDANRVILLDASASSEIPRQFRSKVETWNVPSLLGKDRTHVAQVRDDIRVRVEELSRTLTAADQR